MGKYGKGVNSADGAFAVDQSGPDSVEGRPVGDPEHAVGQPGPGGGTSAGTVAGPDGGNSTAPRPGPDGISRLGLYARAGA